MAGLFLVLIGSVFFCFHNVIVRILFTQQTLFGIWTIGGFVPSTFNDSLLLLIIRMTCVVPLMALMAHRVYGQTWREINHLRQRTQRGTLWGSVGCGALMFLYLVLLYVSISLIPTGIAITLFFTYPLFTALLAWRLFNDAPSLFRWMVMGMTLIGTLLTVPYTHRGDSATIILGIVTGIASGVAYAGYTVFAQQTLRQLHPVPFTWISFAVTLLLSVLSLVLWPPTETPLTWSPLLWWSLLSALFTLAGHVLNNWGIQLIGATRAAIVGATNPALTAVVAGLTIQEALNGLQLFGVFIVTFSVALLNYEKTG